MKRISDELRKSIINYYYFHNKNEGFTVLDITKIFGICRSTFYNFIKAYYNGTLYKNDNEARKRITSKITEEVLLLKINFLIIKNYVTKYEKSLM
jgi:transposase